MADDATVSIGDRLSQWTPRRFLPLVERIKSSPIGCRLAKGAFWSLIGTVLSRSLSVVASICVARMLGKVGMGELGIIQSTVGIFSAFAGLGMGLTATKFVAEYRTKVPRRAAAMLSLSAAVSWTSGAAMMLAMLVLAPWFARHTLAVASPGRDDPGWLRAFTYRVSKWRANRGIGGL